MGNEAGTPPGLVDRIRQVAADEVRKFARSGFLRNASISDGGLTVKGGFFRLLTKATGGVTMFYLGPSTSLLPDGSAQQVWFVNRADGARALELFDADTSDGQINQALTWRDRNGNIVLADDTNSGQGVARPWISGHFGRTRFGDMDVYTSSTTFETLWDARITKQQPKLVARYRVAADTSGSTAEVRLLVNGIPVGAVNTHGFSVSTSFIGPAEVPGAHMSTMTVELQARIASGTGAVRLESLGWEGRQT